MLVCVGAMHYLTRTPFGRMANAVRDNSGRVGFIGYSTHLLRYQVLVTSAAFAGIAGGLAAINNEIVTVETVGVGASGTVLLMVFIGGIGHFVGPVIGAVIVTLLETVVSSATRAWQFYFGLLFLCMVLFAPGGFASLFAILLPPLRRLRTMRLVLPGYVAGLAGLVLLVGAIVIAVESGYHVAEHSMSAEFHLFGQTFENGAATPLGTALVLALFGSFALRSAIARTADALAVLGTQTLMHGTTKPVTPNTAKPVEGWQT
jgi:branched-chain amino acid transport system permease protein